MTPTLHLPSFSFICMHLLKLSLKDQNLSCITLCRVCIHDHSVQSVHPWL